MAPILIVHIGICGCGSRTRTSSHIGTSAEYKPIIALPAVSVRQDDPLSHPHLPHNPTPLFFDRVGALSVVLLSPLTTFYMSLIWRASNEFVPDRRLPSGNSTRQSESGTKILAHAPGWTIFRNLYTSNGTLYIVRDDLLNGEDVGFWCLGQIEPQRSGPRQFT